MHIALYNLTTTTKIGGVESFVWDLGRQLIERGHRVSMLGGVGLRREPIAGVRVLAFPFISRRVWQAIPPLRRAYAEAKLLERLTFAVPALPHLIHGGYDIVHIQKPYDLAPVLLARSLGGPRVVLGCHGEDWYVADWHLARHVDAAVSCSHFNAQTVAARYGFTPAVIFNGIDLSLFGPGDADTELRADLRTRGYRVDASTPLLLSVGRLQPWKGVDIVIQSLFYMHTNPQPALIIAGDGEERSRLEALVQASGMQQRVAFLGSIPRTDLPRLYRSVDLLVATSFASETFGITLVEAQACGLPVVASRFGGFPEVIAEDQTGLLVTPRDPQALAGAISQLLNDAPRRQQMAAAAPAWAAQFSWPAVTDRVEAAYRLALAAN
ncbi:MAG: glycosyltransferase family 4 protein [Chloroflexaceae bacterium]|nr:glycosyltransferase family 4 protein [Chloroflexaceae bacterium]